MASKSSFGLSSNIRNMPMLTFISCAKTMASHCSLKVPEVTVPYFEAEAVRNALEM